MKSAKPWVVMLAVGTAVAGCEEPSSPPDPALMTLPILEPTGTTTSREFVRLFAETCIPGFPDQQAMVAAFLDNGFTEHVPTGGRDWRESRHFDRASDDLSASVGLASRIGPAFPFGDRLIFSFGCRLHGDLSDPANFEAEMLAMVDADGAPLAWRSLGSSYSMDQERDGLMAELNAFPPSLHAFGRPMMTDPATLCGGLPECRSWSSASMTIVVPVDLSAR